VEVKRAIPRNDTNRTNKLYVRGLSEDTTKQEILEGFAEAGFGDKVVSVKVMTDKETDKSRGFCFVDLVEAEDVDDVLTIGTITIMVRATCTWIQHACALINDAN